MRGAWRLALVILLALGASRAGAEGVAAGTAIRNSASATYDAAGTSTTVTSGAVTVTVVEVLDLDVTLQTAGDVAVSPGDSDRVLTFLLTNTGNGVDTYQLSADSTLPGDDFDPTLVGIYLDADGDGLYAPGIDPAYVSGSNDPTLDANDPASLSITVFVLNDIPGATAFDLAGTSRLTGTSTAGTGTPGTLLPGAGEGGLDAVIGVHGGVDDDVGTYRTTAVIVDVIKSSTVVALGGGSDPTTGATVTYQLVVRASGAGTATDVTVSDPLPTGLSYVPGSMTLDGVVLTDADDAPIDDADFDLTAPDTVTVHLGDLAGGSADRTITFATTID